MFSGLRSLRREREIRKNRKIPMDNVHLMAVVDTRENLLHKDGSITFCEFTSSNDFIEELSAFTDSK
jgi:hypothetical protein